MGDYCQPEMRVVSYVKTLKVVVFAIYSEMKKYLRPFDFFFVCFLSLSAHPLLFITKRPSNKLMKDGLSSSNADIGSMSQ